MDLRKAAPDETAELSLARNRPKRRGILSSRTRIRLVLFMLFAVVALIGLFSPLSSASAASSAYWDAEYSNNSSFINLPIFGLYVQDRNDPVINFDWGTGSPGLTGIPADDFWARWERTLYFMAGTYRFTVTVDDGVRLYIDGDLVIDKWIVQASTTYTADRVLTEGNHTIKMEYFEKTVYAVAKLSWSYQTGPLYEWKGEYYNNTSLSGGEAAYRDDAAIDFNWGAGAAITGVGTDNFSVRWTSTVPFAAGTYRFSTTTDDGVRLWVDGDLIIDKWFPQVPTTYTADRTLTAGNHIIKMEYFEATVNAVARLSWQALPPPSFTYWRGEYFSNKTLSGSPTAYRDDQNINFDWGSGSPIAQVPADGFSVRWTRTLPFAAGKYRFSATVDDGVRLWVDGSLVIDKWFAQPVTTYTADVTLTAGDHDIKMEYYEVTVYAVAKLSWQALAPPSFTYWKGEYFSNKTLTGDPTAYRDDPNIDFDWGTGIPIAQVPADNFSVRWTRTLDFTAGTYRFTTRTDDGVRLYVDGTLVIDKWLVQVATTYTADVSLTAGLHTIKMEFFENGVYAIAKLSWEALVPVPVPTGLSATAGDSQVQLAWNGVAGASGYNLYRGGVKITPTALTTTSYLDPGLTNGTTYSYQVTAIVGGQESNKSSPVTATPQAVVIPVPTGLAATAGDGQVQLAWNGVSGASGYNLYRGGVKVNAAVITAVSYLDIGLTNGTTYSYQVTAIVGGQESDKSSAVTATPQAITPTFVDVPASHPYYLAINILAGRGIINGYPEDHTFRPDNPVLRQQFAKMIVKTLGYPVSDANICPFIDVPLSLPGNYLDLTDFNYPDHYVAVCAAHQITVGTSPTTFDPYGNITRQQLITMVVRAANLLEPPASYVPPFSAGQFYPEEHYLNARKAAYAGLLTGLQGVGPAYNFFGASSRGEVAQILANLISSLGL